MSEVRASVKTTMSMRTIANPRRTTLAHLQDADEMATEAAGAESADESAALPSRTANPQRTVLEETPAG